VVWLFKYEKSSHKGFCNLLAYSQIKEEMNSFRTIRCRYNLVCTRVFVVVKSTLGREEPFFMWNILFLWQSDDNNRRKKLGFVILCLFPPHTCIINRVKSQMDNLEGIFKFAYFNGMTKLILYACTMIIFVRIFYDLLAIYQTDFNKFVSSQAIFNIDCHQYLYKHWKSWH